VSGTHLIPLPDAHARGSDPAVDELLDVLVPAESGNTCADARIGDRQVGEQLVDGWRDVVSQDPRKPLLHLCDPLLLLSSRTDLADLESEESAQLGIVDVNLVELASELVLRLCTRLLGSCNPLRGIVRVASVEESLDASDDLLTDRGIRRDARAEDSSRPG
jgi:hypothetical protein